MHLNVGFPTPVPAPALFLHPDNSLIAQPPCKLILLPTPQVLASHCQSDLRAATAESQSLCPTFPGPGQQRQRNC